MYILHYLLLCGVESGGFALSEGEGVRGGNEGGTLCGCICVVAVPRYKQGMFIPI